MSAGKTPEGTPKGRLPGRKLHQEQSPLEQPLLPRNAGRNIRSARPLPGTPTAADGSMDGTGALLGNFGRAGFSEDAAGKGC